jgi:hypothetical protein
MTVHLFLIFGWYLSYTGRKAQGKLSQHRIRAGTRKLEFSLIFIAKKYRASAKNILAPFPELSF